MSNAKRWKKYEGGGGDWYKWENEGQELEGEWQGIIGHSGQYDTPNGQINTADGPVKFGCPTGLANQVRNIPTGVEIKIKYVGMKLNPSSKRNFKSFDIWVNEEQEVK